MQIQKAYKILTSTHEVLKIKFDEEIEDWKPDEPPVTTMMSCFAEALLNHESDFTDEQYSLVFVNIEKLLSDYGDEVKNAVATGLLETLINMSGHNKPERFTSFLGEKSKEYCIAWDNFTGVRTLGLYRAV